MWPDGQRPELIEGEHPVGEVAGDVLDAGQFGVPVRIVGFLPGLGLLEGDLVPVQKLPQPLAADPDQADRALFQEDAGDEHALDL
jgi:hypothetical protein